MVSAVKVIIAKTGDLAFTVVQSTKDVQVLNYIKDNLGFGRVVLQSSNKNTHRFCVKDIKNLFRNAIFFYLYYLYYLYSSPVTLLYNWFPVIF